MKAAMCLELDQPLAVEDVTPIDPGPDDVIVRITASGVCHSDLSVINGTLPAGRVVLGHEGTGVVEKVGADVSRLAVGDRVIGSFIPACGVCWYCLNDQSNLCAETYSVMFTPRVRRADGEELQAMTGFLAVDLEGCSSPTRTLWINVSEYPPMPRTAFLQTWTSGWSLAWPKSAAKEPGKQVSSAPVSSSMFTP